MKASELLENILARLQDDSIMSELKPELEQLDSNDRTVLIVELIMGLAEDAGCILRMAGDFIYCFNGSYWETISDDKLKMFLGSVLKILGGSDMKARHYRRKDELFRQFVSEAIFVPAERNHDVTLINLRNGTFEITSDSQRLRSPKAEDFLRYRLDFDYDPDAKAPMFEAYLNRVLPDVDCQKVLSEYMGYVFAKSLKLEKVLLLYGSGANGKSVFFDIILAVLGHDNVSSFSLSQLTNEQGYQRAELQNVLLNYASELNGKMETSSFKQLVSNEPVSVRRIYGNPQMMTDYGRLMFNCNELPRETEQTDAFFRRFIVIPFSQTIPVEEQDKDLSKKIIRNELSGVFNWILDGLRRLLENRCFTESEVIREQVEQFRMDSDSVAMFLAEEKYTISPGIKTYLKDIYASYCSFCRNCGQRAVAMKRVAGKLRGLGYQSGRDSQGTYFEIESQADCMKREQQEDMRRAIQERRASECSLSHDSSGVRQLKPKRRQAPKESPTHLNKE